MYPSPYLEFKNRRQEEEWLESDGIHPALRVLVLAAARWHYLRTGRPAVLTHLMCSRAEQLAIHRGQEDARSPHEFGRAADLRTMGMGSADAREWASWINSSFAYAGSPGIRTALVHQVAGFGEHLHLQVGPLEKVPGEKRQGGLRRSA